MLNVLNIKFKATVVKLCPIYTFRIDDSIFQLPQLLIDCLLKMTTDKHQRPHCPNTKETFLFLIRHAGNRWDVIFKTRALLTIWSREAFLMWFCSPWRNIFYNEIRERDCSQVSTRRPLFQLIFTNPEKEDCHSTNCLLLLPLLRK